MNRINNTDEAKDNYLKKLLEMLEAGNLNPGLTNCIVAHDANCGIFSGSPCNCDPEIRLEPHVERSKAQ